MGFLSEENKEELEELYNDIPQSWFKNNPTKELEVETTLLLSDYEQEGYKEDLLNHLLVSYHTFSTHAMSDFAIYLRGQKNMLGTLILIIKRS